MGLSRVTRESTSRFAHMDPTATAPRSSCSSPRAESRVHRRENSTLPPASTRRRRESQPRCRAISSSTHRHRLGHRPVRTRLPTPLTGRGCAVDGVLVPILHLLGRFVDDVAIVSDPEGELVWLFVVVFDDERTEPGVTVDSGQTASSDGCGGCKARQNRSTWRGHASLFCTRSNSASWESLTGNLDAR